MTCFCYDYSDSEIYRTGCSGHRCLFRRLVLQPLRIRAPVFIPATCPTAITDPSTGVCSGDLSYCHYGSEPRCLFRRLVLQPLRIRAPVFVPATCPTAITDPGTGVCSGDLPYSHYRSGYRRLFVRLALQPLQLRAPVFVPATCPAAFTAAKPQQSQHDLTEDTGTSSTAIGVIDCASSVLASKAISTPDLSTTVTVPTPT